MTRNIFLLLLTVFSFIGTPTKNETKPEIIKDYNSLETIEYKTQQLDSLLIQIEKLNK